MDNLLMSQFIKLRAALAEELSPYLADISQGKMYNSDAIAEKLMLNFSINFPKENN